MVVVVRCTTARPAGIPDRSAAVASATGELEKRRAGNFPAFFVFGNLAVAKAQQKTPPKQAGFSII
jgi:hypothetical protein